MKNQLLSLFLLFSCLSLSAQTVSYEFYDTIRYTDGSFISPNTVLNDIDDDGNMVGYYEDDDGFNAGLLVLANGKTSTFEFFGYNNTEITGINNNGFVVGKAYNSSNAAVVFRAQIINDLIDAAVELDWNDPNGISKNVGKLNDDEVAVGNVRISTQNWLHYESIIAPFTVNESERYSTTNPSFVSYNTYGLGLNNYEKYTGWYLDGTNRIPYVYDGISNAFFPQAHYPSGALQLRTYLNDINDNGYMAVSYVNSSVKFQGTIGFYDGASTTYEGNFPFISFQNFELFGINNNNDVVGYYENSSGQRIGVYMLVEGPELEGFDIADDALSFANDSLTFNYIPGQFDYINKDEYLGVQDSFYANYIQDINFVLDVDQTNSIYSGSRNLSWPAFVLIREEERSYVTQIDGTRIPREDAIINWLERSNNQFDGYCFGMSIFALQNLSNPSLLLDRFPSYYTPEQNGVNYTPTNIFFREMLAALQLQQIGNVFSDVWSDQSVLRSAFSDNNLSALGELMRPKVYDVIEGVKTGSPDSSYILSFYITGSSPGYHAVMPFKVTRKIFLGISGDTIHCVDPNYPLQVLKVYVDYGNGQSKGFVNGNQVYSIGFVYNSSYLKNILPEYQVDFREEEIMTSPKSLGPSATFLNTERLCDFTMENIDNPSEFINVNGNDYSSSWPGIGTYFKMDQDDKLDHIIGQGDINVETNINACSTRNYLSYRYQDGLMVYEREGVQIGETDIVRNMENVMMVTNPNSTSFEANVIALHSGVNAETMIAIKDYTLGQNETVEIETVDATHFLLSNDENDDKMYDLIVHYVDEEDLIDVSFQNIPLNLETSHLIVIQPTVEDAEVIILVDENQDGIIEDTLFGMIEEPTGIIDDANLHEFVVYPNPVKDVLNFKITYAKQVILNFSLENIFGQVIASDKLLSIHQNDFKVDVSDLAEGIYFLNIINEQNVVIGKRKVYIQ